ncbi:hypothetical protein BCT81_13620 [Vibrio sp. 10N.261.52.A1]|nr:hypothetical protein BCT81_13620 [Vibrio sp. 10N.261.52.A1]
MVFNQTAVAMTALMTMPAALISGLDSAGPKRWTRFAITATAWGLTQAVSSLLLISGLTFLVTFGS